MRNMEPQRRNGLPSNNEKGEAVSEAFQHVLIELLSPENATDILVIS